MKKYVSIIALFTLAVFAFSACNQQQSVDERAQEAITALAARNMKALADLVHPSEGVRFSPYGNININNDVKLAADVVKTRMDSNKTYIWGAYDGSGEPIEKTFKDYFDEFVYDQDFANAEKIAKDEIIGTGNTINNIEEVYPNTQFVEYYFSGFDPDYGGMDWVSLRLVFEQKDGTWYLVGIVHDQWTI